MRYPVGPDERVAGAPMFVETEDGFALTDAARALLAAMDAAEAAVDAAAEGHPTPPPAPPEPPTVMERLVAVRTELEALATELPAAVRLLEPFEVLDCVETVQEITNLAGSVDQAVVAEVDRTDAFERWGHPSTAMLLVDRLRVRPSEAKRRVTTARACVERVGIDGQLSPPLRPVVAAAQAAGSISPDHAAVIVQCLAGLPTTLPVPTVDAVEQALVELAGQRHPSDVATLGRAVRDRLDEDGPQPRDQRVRLARAVRMGQGDDGAGWLRGTLTAGLLAKLQAVLSPLAAPRPDDANGPDTRSPAQRLHDALEDVCDRLLRSGTLPDSGGVPATVCVTMTLRELETRTGRVSTAHGGDISVPELLALAAEADVIPVVLNDAGGILSYGRSKRFATAAQTKALRARDRGCTFPGCTRPPEWCQRHHVDEWLRDHGPTETDNLALLCGYHHHNFATLGWQVVMREGVPWWIPPPDLDPDQTPRQNQAHRST